MKYRHIRASSNEWIHVHRSRSPRNAGGFDIIVVLGILFLLLIIPGWFWLLLGLGWFFGGVKK